MDIISFLLYFIFNFFFYGFVGWIIENLFCYCTRGHFQKDGFLSGPFKPMYAIAMSTLVLIESNLNINVYFLIPLCFIIPTVVEYITGIIMRNYFNKNYWDYSELKYNFKGIICLEFSMAWTILTFIGVKYLQIVVNNAYEIIYPIWPICSTILVIILFIDEIITLKEFKDKRRVIQN
ncbi:putative ABC transporter permease [uncultured Clostridium sp.]|uniref:putative ABC transporter permease n=1 Tax=uncultured Clostridium sp. TaxID=59620 RepID=UPI003216F923